MAINETITDNGVSSTFNPTGAVTDAVVEGNGKGHVFLECQVPGGEWVTIGDQVGAFSINTPDTAIGYRFRASNVEESVRVYLGP